MYAGAGHRNSTMTGLGTHACLELSPKIDSSQQLLPGAPPPERKSPMNISD